MTDDTTDTLTDPPPADAPAEVVVAEPAPVEAISFWRRPTVERYLVPLVLPIVVVLGLVLFVLNLSRVFLAGHDNSPVIVGSLLTILILVGATIFSNSPRLRSSSIALMTTLFVVVIFTSGWVVLGRSEEQTDGGEPLAAAGPSLATYDIDALAAIKFAPEALEAETGINAITLTDVVSGPHTLLFDDPGTLFAGLAVDTAGEKVSARAFFGEEGEYTFYCSIPGHRAAGMEGVISVAGASKTLEAAEVEVGGGAAEAAPE